jgi:ABC-type nitrate/sulfonate/bicarbonate transport system substrate-binding protein
LNNKRDEIRSFLGALARGTRLAQRDPAVAAGFLSRANRELDPKLQLEGTKRTPFDQPAGKPFGYQDPAQWKRFADFMKTSGILKREPKVDEAFTNDLLPGQGLD